MGIPEGQEFSEEELVRTIASALEAKTIHVGDGSHDRR